MRNTAALLVVLASAALAHAQPAPAPAGSSPAQGVRGVAESALGQCFRRPPRYPVEALRNEQTGRTLVGFVVAADGVITGPTLRQSSGHATLDSAALAHMEGCIARFRASEQPQLPAGTYALPMLWRIE